MLVGRKLGPFLVDKELGAGAMGAVYRAQDEKTGKWVAVKLIAAALANNKSALDRFKREVDILKQLDHPNITKYHGSGRWHGTPFYIMEYIEGESLDHILERRQRVGWDEVIAIGQQLCAALQHAHDKGIIHRDLKPSNLMILEDGTFKLTDFGIAKDTDMTALTAANSTLGTASYMSPEQCKGVRDLTPKSDIYAMGIVFYELLTGRKPFNADNVMEMFRLHTAGTFERPSRWVLDIPVWFDTLICELLEKDPLRRPENAAAVAKSLAKIRDKMQNQASAGAEAAGKRRVDKSAHDLRLSDFDKDLARALLGKKKKAKAQPFYRKNWFTITALSAVAAVLGLLIWLIFLKTPSAEGLYARADRLMQSTKLEDHKEAREGPIEDFLRYHPNHPQATKVAQWRDYVDGEVCDYQMQNRKRKDLKADGEEEQAAFDALADENDGKLAEAKKRWQHLGRLKSETAKERRMWGFMADRYLKELKAVDDLEVELKRKINEEKTFDKKHEGDSSEEKLALAALRAESDEGVDPKLHWDDLKKQAERQPELRRWQLLAAKRIRDLASRSREPSGT